MRELLAPLRPGARVLDLGAGSGSFSTERGDLAVVRADLAPPRTGAPSGPGGAYVLADAARLPFAPGAFDLVISHHSLEHFAELDAALREIGRVTAPSGGLFIAVPDAGTLTDRIYRWLGKGGGHVNAFRSPDEVVRLVERWTGLKHRGTCALSSGLSFLNAHNFIAPPPRKIALFAFGNERFLAVFVWLLRWLDRRLGAGLSRYGWAFYFGNAAPPEDGRPWINVCVRCGAGHPEALLGNRWAYRCPDCGGFNLRT